VPGSHVVVSWSWYWWSDNQRKHGAVQAGLLKAKAKPGEAASLLSKKRGRENHLGHQYASQQTLVVILNKTGVLQSEADKCYDEKFTSFMTPFIAQVSSTAINSTFIRLLL
jgi:hypothetical protein